MSTYTIRCKFSIDTIYLIVALGEMYSRTNPDKTENIMPLIQVTIRAGLEVMKQSKDSDLISVEITQHEMAVMLACLFTTTTLDEFFKAFRNKELTYYTVRENISSDDLQNGINTIESFIKEAYSRLPVEALH